MLDDAHPDLVAARLASGRRGMVRGAELRAAGLSRAAIGHRVATGRLHRIHEDVFLVGLRQLQPLALEQAALLACGPRALLSHRSAGALWRIVARLGDAVDVTVVGSRAPRRADIRGHRTAALAEDEIRTREGLRLTSPARTILDLAASVTTAELERAVNEVQVLGLATVGELKATADRHPGRRGSAGLREVLAAAAGPRVTRSAAERRLLELLRRARLPAPESNVTVLGHEVDLHWPNALLVVEVDGFAAHATRAAFERDRRRDGELQAAGIAVVRVTWRQLTREPEALCALLGRLLGRAV